ncbi:GTA-gp10 family protein [Rhizorhabdus histidinilytica]|uniref:GTA-gp10 family protein n=1 Tax=Rhizorhabdus histidinilytica TaxID=439228 RepID=UPI00158FE0A9|nr:GTA-gp10 family protein [Rhizorhabdus histidinilytica]
MDLDHGRVTSLPTDITIDFADGVYKFALLLPQQIELEDKCGAPDQSGVRRRKGIIEIYADVIAGLLVVDGEVVANPMAGRASAFECREVVRLGLIGGNYGLVDGADIQVSPARALKLVESYVDTRPLVERWTLAAAILRAAVEGFDPPKKAPPAKAPAKRISQKASKLSG